MNRPAILASTTFAGLLLGLALALACGSGGSSDSLYSRTDYTPVAGAEGYAAFDRAYRVPPDRAVLAVTILATQPTAAEATRQVAADVAAVTTAAGSACTASVVNGTPMSGGGENWMSAAEVRVDIDLKGLTDVPGRLARIDACLAALEPALTSNERQKQGGGSHSVRRSAPVLVVDAPLSHREALMTVERERLLWAAGATGAPQLHPTDLRCVPDGTVAVGEARLAGVVLTLGMNCRIEVPEDAAE